MLFKITLLTPKFAIEYLVYSDESKSSTFGLNQNNKPLVVILLLIPKK